MIDAAGKSGVSTPEQVEAYCQGVQTIVDAAQHKMFFEHLGDYIHDFFVLAFQHKVSQIELLKSLFK